jgi:ferredoxin
MRSADKDTLTATDIKVIDKLCEYSLSDELKEFFRKFYGPGGMRRQYWANQDAKRATCRHAKIGYCNGCGICVPFCEDSLLDQLFTVIYCAKQGLFDVEHDSYETAKQEIRVELTNPPPPDPGCPF